MRTSDHRRKKYRIKSKFRFITSLVIMTGLFLGVFGALTGINDSTALTQPKYEQVYINSGDTLWNIVSKYKNENTDTRKAIYEICQINDINASDLQPGMVISIPEDL